MAAILRWPSLGERDQPDVRHYRYSHHVACGQERLRPSDRGPRRFRGQRREAFGGMMKRDILIAVLVVALGGAGFALYRQQSEIARLEQTVDSQTHQITALKAAESAVKT